MVVLEWHWNHANLHGPRPLEGFCVIDPPTQLIFFVGENCYDWVFICGSYLVYPRCAVMPQGFFLVLDLSRLSTTEQ